MAFNGKELYELWTEIVLKQLEKKTDPYRLFPPLTSKQKNELRLSIQEAGLRDPIVVDEFQNIIDGHERKEACEQLGIDCFENAIVRFGLSENEAKALAIELNMFKRTHFLSQEQRRDLIEIYIIANPGISEPRLAEMFGVSQPTINRMKKLLIEVEKIPKVTATVGRDGISRRIGNRRKKQKILMVRSRREYDRLMPDLIQVRDDLKGLIRRPKKFAAKAQRSRALEKLLTKHPPLPEQVQLHHSDFRELPLKTSSVDLILTDPIWSKKAMGDWADVAMLASDWLKPDGRFVAMMGTRSLADFLAVVKQHLNYETTLALPLTPTLRGADRCFVDCWRPIVVFSKTTKPRKVLMKNLLSEIPTQKDKRHHDYQQPLDLSLHLIEKLSNKGDLVVDPFAGTATNAIAATLLERSFVGSELSANQYRVALARIATEGKKRATFQRSSNKGSQTYSFA